MTIQEIIALVFAGCSIIIAFVIAYRQNRIGLQTKSITEKLATDYFVKEQVKKIFPVLAKKDSLSNYKIVFPAKYDGKPLPLINQGDFYAIHVLGMAIGFDKIILKEVDRNNFNTEEAKNFSKGNTIFICSPQANPALNLEFPYATKIVAETTEVNPGNTHNREQHICATDDDTKEWLKNIGLPCWFINSSEVVYNEGTKRNETILVKKIQVYDKDFTGPNDKLSSPLTSGAEECYSEAKRQTLKVSFGNINDIGIFARINKNENRFLILAGIHQYGTWIVSEYLNKILHQETSEEEKIIEKFTGDDDFVAIINGQFESKTMKVDSCKVHCNDLWIRQGSDKRWVRYDRI